MQGGTFENNAVLRALEEYTGRQVIRAPYPGLMGAIGIALLTRERYHEHPENQTFLGLDALEDFTYHQEENAPCPFCTNHCKRTILRFSNGNSWITNNRCERGEILGDPKDEKVRAQLAEQRKKAGAVPNLFQEREKLLLRDYPTPHPIQDRGITIGIPRVLAFWDTLPFWSTLLRGLGFRVQLSDRSTRKLYENGISAVTSDTVCFPAKLVHGHIRNLVEKKVDRIFMPVVTTVPHREHPGHQPLHVRGGQGLPPGGGQLGQPGQTVGRALRRAGLPLVYPPPTGKSSWYSISPKPLKSPPASASGPCAPPRRPSAPSTPRWKPAARRCWTRSPGKTALR